MFWRNNMLKQKFLYIRVFIFILIITPFLTTYFNIKIDRLFYGFTLCGILNAFQLRYIEELTLKIKALEEKID
jgi:hypothetical protein